MVQLMSTLRLPAVACVLTASLASNAAAQLGTEEYARDLTYLLEEWLPNNRALGEDGRVRAQTLLEEARDSASQLTDAAFALLSKLR